MSNDALWFTNTRMNVRLSNLEKGNRISMMEGVMPYGFSPPRHVHHEEDEIFYVLEGHFRFERDGVEIVARPGDVIHAPAGSMHSFIVLSAEGGRLLTITDGGFETMVREVSRPAANGGLPEQTAPNAAEQQKLAQAALRNGIELLGPPLAA